MWYCGSVVYGACGVVNRVVCGTVAYGAYGVVNRAVRGTVDLWYVVRVVWCQVW